MIDFRFIIFHENGIICLIFSTNQNPRHKFETPNIHILFPTLKNKKVFWKVSREKKEKFPRKVDSKAKGVV